MTAVGGNCLVGGQCSGLVVVQTHPALVRAVLQKKNRCRNLNNLWFLVDLGFYILVAFPVYGLQE